MTVSVVIPAYNAAGFIERTLDSVRAQTYTDYEVVVVDDGSADETARVTEDYLARWRMPGRAVRQPNGGIAAARNAGMRAAAGAFIALLDHDDLWYPDKLAAVMEAFERDPAADLVCHDENITRDGAVVRVARRRAPQGPLFEALLFGGNMLSPSATTMRRDKALALGGFDERAEYLTVEDYEFWLRFSREYQIRFLDRVLGEYVMVERAASRRVVFHHTALEGMLRHHLTEYLRSHDGAGVRLRARRRLARVYRSAARQLLIYGEAPHEQQRFISRMLQTFPFELRNLAVAGQWAVMTVGRACRAS